MDLNALSDKLNNLRDELVFFWHNPSTLKAELQASPQLMIEVLIAVMLFFLLLYMLFKPATKVKTPAKPQANPKAEAPVAPKVFSKALTENQKQEPALRPTRPPLKKNTPPTLQELSEEEERALAEAMSAAGKQALAEVSGEPHQAEIFQDTQALDAAKKFFSGQSRLTQEATIGEISKSLSPSEFIMIYFMAPRSQAFEAEVLFQALREELDLALNDQHVFEYADAEGIQFYVTSAIKPGQFDVHRLNYLVPGVSFVLDLKTVGNPTSAFNKMLGMIHELSQLLKGDILDEQRQRLTQGSIHQYLARAKASR